ncbi:MAG: hypothetical protein FJ243_03690 [Nitrospira sp.]|nr:hypothetical protein [Nitrospira sp.]
MEITFTKEQYEDLLKLVYLGNWMVNAHRLSYEETDQFNELESYIFSFAKDAGLEFYSDYAEEFDTYYPTREFEEDTDIEKYMDEYSEETFWDELIHALAGRDFIEKYGELVTRKMSPEEQFKKLQPFIDKYEEEFEKHGIDNLVIKK